MNLVPDTELAKEYGVTPKTLRLWVKEAGVGYHRGPRKKMLFTLDQAVDLMMSRGGTYESSKAIMGALFGVEKEIEPDPEGYVYFIAAEGSGRVKIGSSKDPKTRLSRLKTGSPFPLKILGVVRQSIASEQEVHERFEHLRVNLEWFTLNHEIVDFVNEHKESAK